MLELPRDKLIVMTGLSGRASPLWPLTQSTPRGSDAMWSLCPSYARQFLGRWRSRTWTHRGPLSGDQHRPEDHKPQPALYRGYGDGDYDYLRLMCARVGIPHCPHCGGRFVSRHRPDRRSGARAARRRQMTDPGASSTGQKGRIRESAGRRRKGRLRPRAALTGELYDLSRIRQSLPKRKSTISRWSSIRLVITAGYRPPTYGLLETAAMRLAGGLAR